MMCSSIHTHTHTHTHPIGSIHNTSMQELVRIENGINLYKERKRERDEMLKFQVNCKLSVDVKMNKNLDDFKLLFTKKKPQMNA